MPAPARPMALPGEELCPSTLLFGLTPPFGFLGEGQPAGGAGPAEGPGEGSGGAPDAGRPCRVAASPFGRGSAGLQALPSLLQLAHHAGQSAPDSPSMSITTPFNHVPDLLDGGNPQSARVVFGVEQFSNGLHNQSSDDSVVLAAPLRLAGPERWSVDSTQRFGPAGVPSDAEAPNNPSMPGQDSGREGELNSLHATRTQPFQVPTGPQEVPMDSVGAGVFAARDCSERLSCSTAGEQHPRCGDGKARTRMFDTSVAPEEPALQRSRPNKQARHFTALSTRELEHIHQLTMELQQSKIEKAALEIQVRQLRDAGASNEGSSPAALKVSLWEGEAMTLTRQQVLSLPRDTFIALVKDYLLKVAELLGGGCPGRAERAGLLAGEAFNLLGCLTGSSALYGRVLECLRLDETRMVADAAPPAKWAHVLRALRLSPPQAQELLMYREELVAKMSEVLRERRLVQATMAAMARCEGGVVGTAQGLAVEYLKAAAALEQLQFNLGRDCLLLRRFSDHVLWQILSARQRAEMLVASFPYLPDALAVAHCLAAARGDPSAPAHLVPRPTMLADMAAVLPGAVVLPPAWRP